MLEAWTNFYVMTGTSAAALIGLTFVVITVTVAAIRSDANPTHDGISTFTTPIVVHFGTALLTSAIFCAPWWSPRPPATIAGFLGLIGIVYSLRVALRARRLDSYRLDAEDWTWYHIVPSILYVLLFAGSLFLGAAHQAGVYAVAAAVLGLLFVGVRNSWDVVTYLVVRR